ncbi:hypothetical protein [Flavobacterium frigoris]|uniref:Uncharacterized protein n=1 Tax=Flavobacterium frigoris (strain PS1) TaxID=1086011 RepID=H7FPJ6_FLAFP|nr:hypothetical protein [Flavobacterium frigoris]EIA09676.1 hypothetical protein HJ01_01094 [Flavobacterium frigoris PS1]
MKNILTYLLLISFSIAFGQSDSLTTTKINDINCEADFFLGFDQFGFYYSITNNVLYKIKEDETFEYKNPTLGKITKIDLQNPLKIVVFYESFNSVVLLDNQLNEVQKINFTENTTPIIVAATGIASQNQLWVYDSLNQQIGLFDYLKNNYRAISTSFPESIKQYQSDFNTFNWIDDNNNLFSCDIFGKIATKGKIPNFDFIEIINDQQYIFSKNSILIFEDLTKNEKYKIEISEKTFQKFYYKDQILSIFTSKGIINYKITTP